MGVKGVLFLIWELTDANKMILKEFHNAVERKMTLEAKFLCS